MAQLSNVGFDLQTEAQNEAAIAAGTMPQPASAVLIRPQGQQPAIVGDPGFVPASAFEMPQQQAQAMPVQQQITQTSTPGIQITPQQQRELDESDKAIIKARKENIAAQDAAMAEQNKYNQMMLEERNKLAQEQLAIQQKAKANLEKSQADYEALYNDAKNSSIDPDRFFDGKTENRILAALVAGAGAWSAAMTGGKNYALDAINQGIEQDIQMQKVAMLRKDQRAADARRNFELAQEKFGNADAAYRVMRLEAVEAMGKKLLAQANNDVTRANLAAELAELGGILVRRRLELAQATSSKTSTSTMTQIGGVAGGETPSDRIRKNAEINTAMEWDNTLKTVMESFDKAGKVKFIEGKAPQFLPGSKKALSESEQANIAAQLIGKVPGIRSDKDFERIIVPLLPNPGDTVQSVKYKREAFASFLRSSAPAAYLKRQQTKTYVPESFRSEGGK